MKNRKLKKFVKPIVYALIFFAFLMSFIIIDEKKDMSVMSNNSDYEYVNRSIIPYNNMPVLSEDKTIMNPYNSDEIEVSKRFYDSTLSDEEKQNAIIFYNDTYIQNSGILYKSSNEFDVVSILDGTVIDVKKDEVLGNVVDIKHSNNIISTYQGLNMVNVKKGQILSQGEVIGKSGKLELEESLDNALLFEIIKDGKYINPQDCIGKKLSEL